MAENTYKSCFLVRPQGSEQRTPTPPNARFPAKQMPLSSLGCSAFSLSRNSVKEEKPRGAYHLTCANSSWMCILSFRYKVTSRRMQVRMETSSWKMLFSLIEDPLPHTSKWQHISASCRNVLPGNALSTDEGYMPGRWNA